MENQHRRKSSGWSMAVALVALILAVAALVLSWQTYAIGKRNVAALSALQLRSVALSSRPFGDELRFLREATAGRPDLKGALDSLAQLESSGLPSLQALDEQFRKATAAALVAEQSRPSLGMLNSLTSHIAAAAVVIGMEAGSNPLDSVVTPAITSAEGFLQEGQLAQSIAAINDVPAEFATNFDAWKASAEARVAAEQALDELVRKLVPGDAAAK